MVSSPATTVAAYLQSLPAERRAVVSQVRATINANLPAGYEERMQYGMISWGVPLAQYADTNGQPLVVTALAAQKNAYSLYLMGLYMIPALAAWFVGAYEKTGKRLDMGKSCVRFRSLDALPLDVIGQAASKVSVAKLIAAHGAAKSPAATAKRRTAAKPAAKSTSKSTPRRAR